MTPALVLDLDAFEQNISAYQQLIDAQGLKARPHAKSHKCAEIARRQIAAGGVGISTATLHEAEALAEKGITDILITSPIVGLAMATTSTLRGALASSASIHAPIGARSRLIRIAAARAP